MEKSQFRYRPIVFIYLLLGALLGDESALASMSITEVGADSGNIRFLAQATRPSSEAGDSVGPSAERTQSDTAMREPASFRPKKRSPESGTLSQPVPQPAEAIVPTDSVPSQGASDFGLSGDWGGTRTRLDERGVDIGLIYKGEFGRVLSGGLERRSSYLQNLDVRLLVDAEKLVGLRGTTFFIYGLGDWGGSSGRTPTTFAGDAQGVSNIETATDAFRIYEIWVEKTFAEGKASVLAGIHDLNSEFYVTESSTLFINASFGIGRDLSQTGEAGPSIFPATTAAVRARAELDENFYLQTAIFGAKAGEAQDPKHIHWSLNSNDGFLLINEVGVAGPEDDAYKFGFGYWTYTSASDHLTETVTDSSGATGPKQVNNSGAYFLADYPWTQRLSSFARFGFAAEGPNEVKNNVSVGCVGSGFLPARPEDKIGLALTSVQAVDDALPAETVYELTYRAELGQGVALQPDVQWVRHPGFAADLNDTTVGMIRFEVNF
ncbi:MAG: carbohydrate porin [Bdellovibrionaceae bacterium]|nr:carbohydrate porin [Pseudobdellovibrionaceae bacterium]